MPNAYIIECVRTAGGKKNGRLKQWHPVDLGAAVLDALVVRTGIDPSLIEDVIVGCVSQNGGQAGNIGRNMVLASKHLPITVPGTSVDRQCGSSQQAIHFAAMAVMSGVQDVVIAAGVEHMSSVPIGSNIADSFKTDASRGIPMSPILFKKYGKQLAARGRKMFSQFEGAEILCEKYNITREEMELFAVESHRKAQLATDQGLFKDEIVVLKGTDKEGNAVEHSTDEGIRPHTNAASLAKLKDLKSLQTRGKFSGLVTAAHSSQICDGAAAMLIANEDGLRKLGISPKVKIISLALAGSDPVTMLEGPIPAAKTALKKAGLTIDDMDLYEVNEAFAPVPIAFMKALGADYSKLNVNGGALALGHPLGGTGAKLMTTLVHELCRRKGKYAIQAICEGGGTANATIIERLSVAPKSKL